MDLYWPSYGLWLCLEALGDSLGQTWVFYEEFELLARSYERLGFLVKFELFGSELTPWGTFDYLGQIFTFLRSSSLLGQIYFFGGELRLLARSCLFGRVQPFGSNLVPCMSSGFWPRLDVLE